MYAFLLKETRAPPFLFPSVASFRTFRTPKDCRPRGKNRAGQREGEFKVTAWSDQKGFFIE